MTWLVENAQTLIICAVLLAVVAAIIVSMIRNKKKGASACGCSCASCAMAGKCHPEQNGEK